MNNYIIGSGLTALTILELLRDKDFKLISESNVAMFGGNAKSGVYGPRILHHTEYSEAFLDRVGVNSVAREYRAKYIYKGNEIDFPDEAQIQEYYNKTRSRKQRTTSCLNRGKKSFVGYDMSSNAIHCALWERNNKEAILDKVEKIDIFENRIHLVSGRCLPYDNLIYTSDFTRFLESSGVGKPEAVKTYKRPIVFTTISYGFIKPFDFAGADFIYFLDEDMPYNRATKIDEYACCIESCNSLPDQYSFIIEEETTIDSQIIREIKISKLGNILFAGRFAQYDHSIRLDSIIKRFGKDLLKERASCI